MSHFKKTTSCACCAAPNCLASIKKYLKEINEKSTLEAYSIFEKVEKNYSNYTFEFVENLIEYAFDPNAKHSALAISYLADNEYEKKFNSDQIEKVGFLLSHQNIDLAKSVALLLHRTGYIEEILLYLEPTRAKILKELLEFKETISI